MEGGFNLDKLFTSTSSGNEISKKEALRTPLMQEQCNSFQLLESFGLINGSYLVLDHHLNRLIKSALYFDFKIDLVQIKTDLYQIAKNNPLNHWKIRLLVNKDGSHFTEANSISPSTSQAFFALAKSPIDKSDLFLYHKTTNRSVYEQHKINNTNLMDTLLWNVDYEITEFTFGNIVVELDGIKYTPPISCGLLAGTFREELLAKGLIKEKILQVDALDSYSQIWHINSVRQWVSIKIWP